MKPERVEIVAEIGASHDGSLDGALRLAEACAKAGAHVVKGQVGLRALTAPTSALHDTFRALDLDFSAWERVAKECANLGVRFSASCWSPESFVWLASVGAPWVKIGSGDATWSPALGAAIGCGLPVYLATGMCTRAEVEASVDVIGPRLAALLACTVDYPARTADAHLARMRSLVEIAAERGGRALVGYSSHVPDWRLPFYATQLGAAVLEVHVALAEETARVQGGLVPAELERLAKAIRTRGEDRLPLELRRKALGRSTLGVLPCEKRWLKIARRDPALGVRVA